MSTLQGEISSNRFRHLERQKEARQYLPFRCMPSAHAQGVARTTLTMEGGQFTAFGSASTMVSISKFLDTC